jgi:hypothetical protein
VVHLVRSALPGKSQKTSRLCVLKSYKSISGHTICCKYILILYLYLRLDLRSCGIVPVIFPNKIFVCISFLSHLIWLDFLMSLCLMQTKNDETLHHVSADTPPLLTIGCSHLTMFVNALNASSLWLLRQSILTLPSVGRCEHYYKTMGTLEYCSELETLCQNGVPSSQERANQHGMYDVATMTDIRYFEHKFICNCMCLSWFTICTSVFGLQQQCVVSSYDDTFQTTELEKKDFITTVAHVVLRTRLVLLEELDVLSCCIRWHNKNKHEFSDRIIILQSADKSLARPGRKQATATEDFEFHISYL